LGNVVDGAVDLLVFAVFFRVVGCRCNQLYAALSKYEFEALGDKLTPILASEELWVASKVGVNYFKPGL
jgi:hypothetical protein